MTQPKLNNQQGFMALVSVIIIMAVLVVLAFTLSTAGYFLRFNVLDNNSQKTSLDLANACVQQSMLDLANGTSSFPKTVTIPLGSCKICNVVSSGSQKTITARAVNIAAGSGAYATVSAVVVQDAFNNFTVNSWDEQANYPSPPACAIP